jgi:hypothetical protein
MQPILLQLLVLLLLLCNPTNVSAFGKRRKSHWIGKPKHAIPRHALSLDVRGGSNELHSRADVDNQHLRFKTIARLSRLLHVKREFRSAFSSSLEKCLLRATRPDVLPVCEKQLQKLLLATKRLEAVSDLQDAVSVIMHTCM